MEKINELLNGIDVYGMNISGHVPVHIKDNVQTGYMFVQTQLLIEILKELKELKDGNIEIQGEKRDLLKQLLEQKGFKVKLAGG